MQNFHRFRFTSAQEIEIDNADLWNTGQIGTQYETYSFLAKEEVRSILEKEGYGISNLEMDNLSLEDAFIGMTGKY